MYTMAPNQAFFNNSNICGACFEVTGPKGTQIFMAADNCPVQGNQNYCSGDVTHFDLDQRGFPSIAESVWGATYTQIRPIVCPSNGGVSLIFDDLNDYGNFLAVFVFNHRVPIASVSARDSGSNTAFTKLTRRGDNAWPWSAPAIIVFPVTYQITSIYGQTITATIPNKPTTQYSKFDSTNQFTQWPTNIASNTCPSYTEYNIYVNGLNNGGNAPTGENWQSASFTTVTSGLPSGQTSAARNNIAAYGEWYWGTRGALVPASTVESIELWASAPTSIQNIQITWNNYGNGNRVTLGTVGPTWTKFTFTKAQFGTGMADINTLSIKNGNGSPITGLTIAGYRIIPVAGTATPTRTYSPETDFCHF